MVLGSQGTLFVGSIAPNTVYAVTDSNKDGIGDKVRIIASGLNRPNGVAFKDGALYVAEINRVIRFDDIESRLDNPPPFEVVRDTFPKDQWHGYKYIRFSPDGWLYVPVGAPCNACERDDERFATLMRMRIDAGRPEIFARGIRNTVGFDWHPETHELWFTDNGRDYLGDNLPPDELNHAPSRGLHFGFPYRYGKNIADPEFGFKKPDGHFVACAMPLGAHVAALGMRFYIANIKSKKAFPAVYNNRIFICEHGSWNRSKKSGYRISSVTLKDGKADRYEVFMDGFLNGEEPWGRPVDLCLMDDGSMLVSDDFAGAVYRVSYEGLN